MVAANFDRVWREVGELGRHQVALCLFLALVACLMSPFTLFANAFVLFVPEHHCANGTLVNCRTDNGTGELQRRSDCESWEFSDEVLTSSAATKFELICEHRYLTVVLIACGTGLGLIGSMAFGRLQDRFGRKPAIFLIITVYVVTCLPSAFLHNMFAFIFVRWWAYGTQVSSFSTGYLFALECTGPSKRTTLGALYCAGYAVGAMLFGGIVYVLPELDDYVLATSAPFLLLYLAFPFVLESPRWLFGMGRQDEAIDNITKIARWNGRKVTRKGIEQIVEESKGMEAAEGESLLCHKGPELFRLFKCKKFAYIILTVTATWVATNITYVAIAYNVKNIGANFYVTYVLQAFVEAPAVILNIPIIDYCGRVWPLVITAILSGWSSLSSALVLHYGHTLASAGLAILAKFFICMSYGIIYQYASEIYPTEVRGLAFGFTTFFSCLFTMSMPFIVELSGYYVYLPMVTLGIICCIGGIIVVGLPETKNRPMLETLEQIETEVPVFVQAARENWSMALNAVLRKAAVNG